MPSVIVYHPKKNGKPSKITRPILWYDNFYGKMLSFECSKLKFVYVKEEYLDTPRGRIPKSEATKSDLFFYPVRWQYRMKAEPETFDSISQGHIDKKAIEQWFETYQNYNRTIATLEDANELFVTFSIKDKFNRIKIEDKELDDFTYNLERSNFRFEVR